MIKIRPKKQLRSFFFLAFLFVSASLSAQTFYVNDNSKVGDHYTTAVGNDANPGTASAPFATIQAALDAATGATIIWVDAGIYREDLISNKSNISLRGSNYGINPNTVVRLAESEVQPLSSSPNPDPFVDADYVTIINYYQAVSNVTVDGFTLNGDNTTITGPYTEGGVAVDAKAAISAESGISNASVANNIIKNTSVYGIEFFNFDEVPTTGNSIANNKFDNIVDPTKGIGVFIFNNAYTSVTNNVMTKVGIGIQTGNYHTADPGNSHTISGNTIQAQRCGLFFSLHYDAAPTFAVTSNTFTNFAGFAGSTGVFVGAMQDAVGATFTNNNVTGNTNGYLLWNCPTTSTITLTGGTVSGAGTGVKATNFDATFGNGNATSSIYILNGVTIQNSTKDGVFVQDSSANTNVASVGITVNTSNINGSGRGGVYIAGDDASATVFRSTLNANAAGVYVQGGMMGAITESFITNSTLDGIWVASVAGAAGSINNNSLTGNAGKAINNFSPQTLNATCNWFGSSSSATVATKVAANVTYIPFLVDGTDADGATPGFQPVNGSCTGGATICESAPNQAYKASNSAGTQAYRGELGLEFTVNNPNGILIKQLGAFDDKGDGINGLQPGGGVRVVIFNKATQAPVAGLDATIVGLADAYTGFHRLKNITPVTLLPGTYILVAKGYGPNEMNGNQGSGGAPFPPGDNGNGSITFLNESAYGSDNPSGFFYPTVAGNFGSNHQFQAGTFTFTTSGTCPAANLSNLTISQGTLSPAFSQTTTGYTATVGNGVAAINVTPTVADAGSTVKVNGVTVPSGNFTTVTLAEGSNQIYVVVTAADNVTTKTYVITVVRSITGGCLSPSAQAYTANTSKGTQPFRGELGMQFKVNNPNGIIISQLGAFDDGANGITGSQSGGVRVAVFNRTTHQVVSGLNVVISGSGDPLVGNHRMKTIPSVTLPQGDYIIVAKGYGFTEMNGNVFSGGGPFPAGNDGGGAISFGNLTSYGADSPDGFGYPSTEQDFGNNQVFLAGSFTFATAVPCGGGSCESAPSLAYSSNTTSGNQAYKGELGMQFMVSNPAGISIKQLGAFDDGGNGITGLQPGGAVRVAIFNRTTHQIVPGLDASISGLADGYNGNHRLKNITPVTLPPGDYVIVSKGYNVSERNGNSLAGGGAYPAGNTGNGAVVFGSLSSYGPDDATGFNYPTNEGDFGTSHVFLAGTFNFTTMISCAPAAVTRVAAIVDSTQLVKTTAQDAELVKIYPNPTSGRFKLQLRDVNAPKLNIQVINANGQTVDQKLIPVLTKTALMTVDFNLHQPSGIYLVKVASSDGIKTVKLVIQK